MSEFENASSTTWFPPEIIKSFLIIRRALQRGRYSQVDYLSQKYQKKFPAYKGYYQEKEAIAHKRRGRKTKSLELLKDSNMFFNGKSLPTLANLIRELLLTEKEEAERYIHQGLKDFPEEKILLFLQARLFFEQGHIQKAIDQLEYLSLKSSEVMYHYLLGEYNFELGRYDKALQEFEKAQNLDPSFIPAWCNHIFFSHYMPQFNHEDLLKIIQKWFKTVCQSLEPTKGNALERKRQKNKKLRIGILSSGLHQHPVGWMTAQAFRWLSKLPDYELFFYSIGEYNNSNDTILPIFKAASSKWVNVLDKEEEWLYKRLLSDKLDIALDLCGHGDGYVLPLFARRIAPIQVKWLGGLFDTTGVPTMDYLLSDNYETPSGCDHEYTEKLVRLPNSYISYSLKDYGEQQRLRKTNDEPFCFGCFNNRYKLNPVVAEVWSRILKQVPNSILFLKDIKLDLPELKDYILGLFTAHGISKERIYIEGGSSHDILMLSYNRVDIALDPWPYTGGLTTLEALWMGVPVITTPGPSFAGRHAASHLYNVGLPMLVAEDFEQYIDLAIKLANNQPLLDELRTLIPYSVATSPIVRHEQLAADLNTAFRAMWERYCDGLSPISMRFEQQSELPKEFLPFLKQEKV